MVWWKRWCSVVKEVERCGEEGGVVWWRRWSGVVEEVEWSGVVEKVEVQNKDKHYYKVIQPK